MARMPFIAAALNRLSPSTVARAAALCCSLAGAARAGPCDPAWVNISGADVSRSVSCAAYDEARQQIVVFGGTVLNGPVGDTLVWDGDQWRTVSTAGPGVRRDAAMAYDAAHQRIVLFGGHDGNRDRGDTWLWDGSEWTPIAAPGPSPRSGHRMAYDRRRHTVVLYGGASGAPAQETWEWDGAAWAQKAQGGPEATSQFGMAYDPIREQVITFGGTNPAVQGWDGTAWSIVTPDGPGPRSQHAMVTDPVGRRVLVYGGYSQYSDTMAWNGTVWAQLSSGFPLYRHAMIAEFDAIRARFIIAGGRQFLPGGGTPFMSETFVFNGSAWAQSTGPELLRRRGAAAAFDRDRGVTVMFGGASASGDLFGDTVEWAGDAWKRISTAGPGPRSNAAMSADLNPGVLLFGGYDGVQRRGDTWRWDGTAWTLAAASGPSPREDAALAFDSQRGKVILFGGLGEFGPLDDTWEWNGAAWTQIPVVGPSPRSGHAMAYDPGLQRTVLFGGDDQGETWEYNGSLWTRAGTGAEAIHAAAMVYDGAAFRITRFGGLRLGAIPSNQMWFYAGGGSWTTQSTPGAPERRADHILVYDSLRRAVIAATGVGPDPGVLPNDARAYRFTDGPVVTSQPEPLAVAEGGTARFAIRVFSRTPEQRFTWRRNGADIGSDPRISGAARNILTIRNVTAADAGLYTCTTFDTCASSTSAVAELTILCRADLSGDALVDFSDYLVFLNLFETSHPDADFNKDGLVDFADYLEFLNHYEAGC